MSYLDSEDTKKQSEKLDVSSMLKPMEEEAVVPMEKPKVEEKKQEKPEEKQSSRRENTGGSSLEEKLKDDLKLSYEADGILDITVGGYGFLRKDYGINPNEDIYVSTSQIRRFWLRKGDLVEGLARPPKEGERFHSLLLIKKINEKEMNEEESRKRVNFDQLTSLHPDKQIKLETKKEVLSMRITDLVAPIGFGQRALIVSQPKAGKTTFLKEMAEAISINHPKVKLMAILIGERPEEVTDLKRFVKGEDVIILLDSITRLARAFNLSVSGTGRSLSGGFDPSALFPAKKFLGAARNCEEGGSLTIIGTALIGTESRMDDLIYEEFKGTGNMELHLDRKHADKRIFPAIDIERSGTRHDELLFSKEMLDNVNTLRRMLGLLNSEERVTVMI